MNSELIYFFKFPSHKNRFDFSVSDYLSWNDLVLENKHDYIQWIFPTKQKSLFNVNSPILDDETIEKLKNDNDFLVLHNKCGNHMINFLKIRNSTVPFWWNGYNHNCLRVTRILESMSVLGNGELAEEMYRLLMDLYKSNPLSQKTIDFWKKSIEKIC